MSSHFHCCRVDTDFRGGWFPLPDSCRVGGWSHYFIDHYTNLIDLKLGLSMLHTIWTDLALNLIRILHWLIYHPGRG